MSRATGPKDEAAWVDTMFAWIAVATCIGLVGIMFWMAWMFFNTNY